MTNRIYRQSGIPDTQDLTIEETTGSNAVFRISDLSDNTIAEITISDDQAGYIAGLLNARFCRHQGYKNYETFAVCNWLDNDQELQSEAITVALEAARGEEHPDASAAQALRTWVEEYHLTSDPHADAEDVLGGPASSLLNSAMGAVDWLEVAQTRIQTAGEIAANSLPVRTDDPEQTEMILLSAGRCAHQTGYGLPHMEYCGKKLPCTEHPGD